MFLIATLVHASALLAIISFFNFWYDVGIVCGTDVVGERDARVGKIFNRNTELFFKTRSIHGINNSELVEEFMVTLKIFGFLFDWMYHCVTELPLYLHKNVLSGEIR